MAIPKIIHYCWFGRGPMPESAVRYIESWKRHCPDYRIQEWNEDNFDVESNRYVKEAYEARKFAFVTDFVRLYALYHEGGIYMDTDVEVLKPLDAFLEHRAFSGFENNDSVPTGLMASEKGGEWVKHLLEEYRDLSFYLEDGSMDLTTNVVRITRRTQSRYGLVCKSSYQDLGDVTFYPHDYFCPKDWETGDIHLTKHSHTIHHFAGSWHDEADKKRAEQYRKRLQTYVEKYGEEQGKLRMRKADSVRFYLTHPHKILKKLITGKRD